MGCKKKEQVNVNLDYSSHLKRQVCLTEKYYNIFSTKNLLNKRNKLVTKFRHENQFRLANYKDIEP